MISFYQLIINLIGSYIEWVLGILVLVVFLSTKVKRAVDFMFHFEQNLAGYCQKEDTMV